MSTLYKALLFIMVACAPVYCCDLAGLLRDADAATVAYLRLLHFLVIDRPALGRETLDDIVKSPRPFNPLDRDQGVLTASQALPFRKSFVEALAGKVDWPRIRESARLMLGEREARNKKREAVEAQTGYVLAPAPVVRDISAKKDLYFGTSPKTHVGPDGALYVLPEGGGHVLRIQDNKSTPIELPGLDRESHFVRSEDGKNSYVVGLAGNAYQLVDVVTGKKKKLAPRLDGTFNQEPVIDAGALVVIRQSYQGRFLDRYPLDGGTASSTKLAGGQCGYWRSPSGKLYAYEMKNQDTVRVRDAVSGETLLETKFQIPESRVLDNTAWLREDDAGNLYFVGQNAKYDFIIKDITRKKSYVHKLGSGTVSEPMISRGRLTLPVSRKGDRLLTFNLDDGNYHEVDAFGGLSNRRRLFTTNDGTTYAAFGYWQEAAGPGGTFSKLYVQNMKTGEVFEYPMDAAGVRDIRAIDTLPDGRVVLIGASASHTHVAVQLYGPTARKIR